MERLITVNYITAIESLFKQVDTSKDGVASCTHAGLQFYLSNPFDYDTLEWRYEGVDKPTKEELDAEIVKIKAEHQANLYQLDRSDSYPNIGDQLDMLYHAINASPDLQVQFADFYNTIKEIKDKYPKQ
jgi:hypothetical protein